MKKLIIPMTAALMLLVGLQAADEKKKEAAAKAKPELVTLELSGKLVKKETKGKNDRTYTYYYLETEEGTKIRLTKTALPKPKKGEDGKKAEALSFDKFLDTKVKIVGKGYVKELKNKQKRTYVRVIESLTKS
jgi:hypothetical protein